jgi:hypothetical protein
MLLFSHKQIRGEEIPVNRASSVWLIPVRRRNAALSVISISTQLENFSTRSNCELEIAVLKCRAGDSKARDGSN